MAKNPGGGICFTAHGTCVEHIMVILQHVSLSIFDSTQPTYARFHEQGDRLEAGRLKEYQNLHPEAHRGNPS